MRNEFTEFGCINYPIYLNEKNQVLHGQVKKY